MLDYKIEYVTDREDEILQKLLVRYDKALALRGAQDMTLGVYIKMLMYTLRLTFLGDNTRLALYQKLAAVLRKNNLMLRIPEPDLPEASYPYYFGSGAQGLTPVQIQALGVDTSAKGEKSYVYSPTVEVYYIAYPAYYGSLSSILDNNSFETLPGWTESTENFTIGVNLVSYYIYEFDYLTTQVNFTNTFKY